MVNKRGRDSKTGGIHPYRRGKTASEHHNGRDDPTTEETNETKG